MFDKSYKCLATDRSLNPGLSWLRVKDLKCQMRSPWAGKLTSFPSMSLRCILRGKVTLCVVQSCFGAGFKGRRLNHTEKIAEVKPMAPITVDIVNEVRVRTAPEVSDATWTPLVLQAGQVLSGEVENGWLKYTDPRYVVYGRDDQKLEALYSILRDGDTELIRLSTKPEPAPDVTPEPRKRTAAASPAPHSSMANPRWGTVSCSSRHSTSATVIATARRARLNSAQSLMWRWARCAGHMAPFTRLGVSACS